MAENNFSSSIYIHMAPYAMQCFSIKKNTVLFDMKFCKLHIVLSPASILPLFMNGNALASKDLLNGNVRKLSPYLSTPLSAYSQSFLRHKKFFIPFNRICKNKLVEYG